ncbi:MAG: acyl-CoA dehydrogenase family protein, partial [Pseudomonadota bacterium]|nr:acyl-CoA dehydrogenase family protein [Pseudomonadota bacterium]
MNFDFSEEQNLLREQARRFLSHRADGTAREILEGEAPFDRDLWCGMAELGWM